MKLLLDTFFATVALSHLMVDTLNGQRAILLTYLSGPLGLNNTAIGTATTIYILSAALAQPFFGWVTDRLGARWVVAGGVLWMAVFFSLALIIPGQLSLLLFVIASAGSGAFHPAGTMQATLRGQTHFSGRQNSAASYFFVFGQMGFFFGPIIAGPLLDRFQTPGLLLVCIPAFIIGLTAILTLKQPEQANPGHSVPHQSFRFASHIGIKSFIAFILFACFQSWAVQNLATFIPKYLFDLGQSASSYGLLTGLAMGLSAVGNVLGAQLADRFGKRPVSFISLFLASVPIVLIPFAKNIDWLYILIPLAGLLIGAVNSIVVVQAQGYIPGGMGLASGLILGILFSSGAIGTLLAGKIADVWGFTPVFYLTAVLALAASICVLANHEKKLVV